MAARDARRWNEEAARLEAYVTAGNSPDVPPIRAWARATADQVHPERLGRLANEYLDETGSPGPAMSATTTKSEGAAVTGNVFRGTTWFPPAAAATRALRHLGGVERLVVTWPRCPRRENRPC
jgi:hypothetical protein